MFSKDEMYKILFPSEFDTYKGKETKLTINSFPLWSITSEKKKKENKTKALKRQHDKEVGL